MKMSTKIIKTIRYSHFHCLRFLAYALWDQPETYCSTFFNFQAVGRASLRSSDDIDNCEEIENEMNAIDDRIEVHIESFNVDEQNKVKYLLMCRKKQNMPTKYFQP